MLVEADFLRLIALTKQEAIAEAMNLSQSQFSRVVSGKAGVTLKHLGAFLDALGLEVKMKNGGEKDDYVKALETVLRHKLAESE